MLLKRILAYAVFAALSAVLVFLLIDGLRQSRTIAQGACLALRPEPQDRPAPPFSLRDLQGVQKSLASLRGKVVLLHFWATWCPPCIEELPSLYKMQSAIANKDFSLLTVAADDSAKVVKDFFAKHGVPPLPVLVDPKKGVPRIYGTTKFPESYLIDRKGRIHYRFVNKRDWSSPAALGCIRSQLSS